MSLPDPVHQPARRHKNFVATHQDMIETAVRLISERGVDSLSISALARSLGINRTTVYYHFKSREELLDAVKTWSAQQLAKAFEQTAPQLDRIDFITRFVLENPELIKLWIDDFISGGDIRDRYPQWDALVAGIRNMPESEGVDAEIYCVIMLTSAIIGPRVFKNSVSPTAVIEDIVRRFRFEQMRLLSRERLIAP